MSVSARARTYHSALGGRAHARAHYIQALKLYRSRARAVGSRIWAKELVEGAAEEKWLSYNTFPGKKNN